MSERFDPVATPDPAARALAACPQLISVDGPWHAATPSRAHRCRLLAEGRPTLDRQRAHCLGAAHVECPTWLEAHGATGGPVRPGPFVATAPVVLEGPGMGLPARGTARRLAAPLTILVVVAAVGALLLARGPFSPDASGTGDGGPSASPVASVGPASAAPTSSPTPAATPVATAKPTPAPTARPTATPRPQTYRVQPGDTLTAIAAKFGTTVKELVALNDIENPSLIRVGQLLKIPPR